MSLDAPLASAARPGGFQVFSDLDEDTFSALKESIATRGVLVPIAVDQHGRIIDGHNRARAAEDLGVECPQVVVEVADHADAKDIALLLNTVRRHLDTTRRREVVAQLRAAGYSLRAIAGAVGVNDKTVRNDLAKATAEGSAVDVPERTQGRDGKSRPSTRPEPKADDVDRSRCTACDRWSMHLEDGLCASCVPVPKSPAPPSAPAPGPAAEPDKRPTPIRPRQPTAEEAKAAEDQQIWEADTATLCRAAFDIASRLMVQGRPEQIAAHWQTQAARVDPVMQWVAEPTGFRRVADMLCDFADLMETTDQEATG